MTRDEAREAVKVLQHYADGGDVQYRDSQGRWQGASGPSFNFFDTVYRVKPKPVEGWGTIWIDNDVETLAGHVSEEAAKACVSNSPGKRRVIRWREVEQ